MIDYWDSKPGTLVKIMPHIPQTTYVWNDDNDDWLYILKNEIKYIPSKSSSIWAITKNPDVWRSEDGQDIISYQKPVKIVDRCFRYEGPHWFAFEIEIDGQTKVYWLSSYNLGPIN